LSPPLSPAGRVVFLIFCPPSSPRHHTLLLRDILLVLLLLLPHSRCLQEIISSFPSFQVFPPCFFTLIPLTDTYFFAPSYQYFSYIVSRNSLCFDRDDLFQCLSVPPSTRFRRRCSPPFILSFFFPTVKPSFRNILCSPSGCLFVPQYRKAGFNQSSPGSVVCSGGAPPPFFEAKISGLEMLDGPLRTFANPGPL